MAQQLLSMNGDLTQPQNLQPSGRMESKKKIPFAEAVLRAKVAQICDSLGFHAITQDSSNILVDLYRHTIYHLGRHCKESANNNGRTEPTIVDLKQAYDFVGISVSELKEHIDSIKLPFPFEVPSSDDNQKPSNRIQRNLHIDDLLEAEKNNQHEDHDDSENKALSESGMDEEEKPPVPLLKDTFTEIANQFQNVTPVSADKKIRLGGRILLLPGTKLKISTPLLPEQEPSTSGGEAIKPPKEKKKKKIEKLKTIVKTEPPSSPIKQPLGKKKKKISREFIIEQSPEQQPQDKKEKSPKVDKTTAGKKTANKKKVRTPSPVAPPLEIPIAEPPPAPLLPEPVKPIVTPELVVPSPKLPKENKAKRKKRDFDEILLPPEEPVVTEPKEPHKSKVNRKKIKTEPTVNITPLDPSAAEPPSFFPILDIKVEPNIEEEQKEIIIHPPISTTPLPKVPKPKKKKKKIAENQFAIVTETVTQVDEKEWFCPACGGPDDGDLMVQCDSCQEWYHLGCTDLKKPPEENENWECDLCFQKAKPQQKRPPSSMEVVKTETPEPVATPPIPQVVPQAPPPAPVPGTSQDDLCPECNLPDNGTLMIQCDDPFCAKWFHGKCVSLLEAPKEDESWFCKVCVEKQASAFKRRRRAK